MRAKSNKKENCIVVVCLKECMYVYMYVYVCVFVLMYKIWFVVWKLKLIHMNMSITFNNSSCCFSQRKYRKNMKNTHNYT